jgi:hypothetical protein
MKSLTLIIVLLLVLTACKTRHVSTARKDSVSVKQSVSNEVMSYKGVDTSKKVTEKHLTESKTIKLTDSSGTVTEITPKGGAVVTVDANGVFHGEAIAIRTINHNTRYKTQTINKDLQQKITQQAGIDTTKSKASFRSVKDSASVQTSSRIVDAKAGSGYLLKLFGVFAMIAVGYYVYRRIKPG